MVCVYCGSATHVNNSRLQKRNNQVWRRRKCEKCGQIFTTHEAADLSDLFQVEKNNEYRPFISDILFTEVLLTLSHRKDCYSASREVTATIIQSLTKGRVEPLIKTSEISQISSDVLKRLDRRAWLRFVAEHPSLQN
jgi:transcriptional repressor NrdR